MAPGSKSCRKFRKNFAKFCNCKNIRVILIYGIILVVCSAITTAVQAAQNDRFLTKASANCNPNDKSINCDKSSLANRTPRQEQKPQHQPSDALKALINWLFGPSANAQKAQVGHAKENSSDFETLIAKPEPKNVLPDESKQSVESDSSDADQLRQKNKRNIEITDIQASVGTELYSSQLHSDPSQVNLKDELDLVEKFDQSVKRQPQLKSDLPKRTGRRTKREPYKPIKVPYTTKSNDPINGNNILRQRQLLVNPFDQQMMALQQQQQAAAAAAAMLHKQQMDSLLHGNRYAVLEDYDRENDDDDTDEESDELDEFTRFGPPLIQHHHMYLRNGLPPPQVPVALPLQRKPGWGLRRRSVSEKKRKQQERRKFEDSENQRDNEAKDGRNGGRKNKKRTSLKNGHWLLDDYDLNSEFYDSPQERKHAPSHLREKNDDIEDKENVVRHRGDMDFIYREFRDNLCKGNECLQPRQDTPEENPTEGESSNSTSEGSSTTEGSSSTTEGGSSTTEGGSSTTEGGNSTTEGGVSSTTEGGSSTTLGESSSTSEGPTTSGSNTTSGGSSTTEGSSNTTETSETSTIGGIESSTSGETGSSTTEKTDSSTTEEAEPSSSTSPESSTTDSTTNTTTSSPKPTPPYTATLNCRCGTQSVREGFIGNGRVVRYNSNPWLVAISNGSSHLCSGSIINDRYILTSNNCVRTASAGTLIVTAGLTSKNATDYNVVRIAKNPNVNLALLKLKSSISPNQNMRPVCLPIGKRAAGDYSTGTLITFKTVAPNLQVVDTEVSILAKDNPKCTSTAKGIFCAAPPGSLKCSGDTGGILMVYRGGYSYEQIGVVAGTVGCRKNNVPGVYTDIRKRTRWILNNSKDGNYCRNPPVSDDDLSSTSRRGDPDFELNEDFEDPYEFENFEDKAGEEDQFGEVLDNSSEGK